MDTEHHISQCRSFRTRGNYLLVIIFDLTQGCWLNFSSGYISPLHVGHRCRIESNRIELNRTELN